MIWLSRSSTFSTKSFVYLIQTSKCLPSHLATQEYIGSERLCRCDVIVFSFQEKCEGELLDHVEYMYPGNKTTWTEGRNALLMQAKKRSKKYHYYIFIDDDIRFAFSKDFLVHQLETKSPLRAFENFLLDYEPVVGLTDYQVHHTAKHFTIRRQILCKYPGPRKRRHISAPSFSAICNAFHYKSLDYLLPYSAKFEHVCWCHSQRNVIAKVEIYFRGQAPMFIPVQSFNKIHRKYPRLQNSTLDTRPVWYSFVKEIVENVPQEYRKEKLIEKFMKTPVHHIENYLTFCLDLPPHFPIVPFQHFSLHIE